MSAPVCDRCAQAILHAASPYTTLHVVTGTNEPTSGAPHPCGCLSSATPLTTRGRRALQGAGGAGIEVRQPWCARRSEEQEGFSSGVDNPSYRHGRRLSFINKFICCHAPFHLPTIFFATAFLGAWRHSSDGKGQCKRAIQVIIITRMKVGHYFVPALRHDFRHPEGTGSAAATWAISPLGNKSLYCSTIHFFEQGESMRMWW
jgi:hypothetical protein